MEKPQKSQNKKQKSKTGRKETPEVATIVKTKKKGKRSSCISWLICGSKQAADDAYEYNAPAQTNIAEEILDTTVKNRDRNQNSRAIEDTSGKHVVNEEIADRTSSTRKSWYDNTENCQQPPTRIDVVPSLLREEKKREMVPIQAQIEHNSMRQQDSMVHQVYNGRKRKDMPTQKRVEHVENDCTKEKEEKDIISSYYKVPMIYHEASKGYEERKYENVSHQKQNFKKGSVNDQEQREGYKGMKRKNEQGEEEPNLSYMKPKETDLGDSQGTTHVQASTTSLSRPLNEVNSASSTNPEAKLQLADPPTQGSHVLKQNHHHFAQQFFSQESVPSPRAKPFDKRSENTPSLYLSTFQENASGRQHDKPDIPAKNKELAENNPCLAKAADDVGRTDEKIPSYESLHDSSIDANLQRSIINSSYPKPSVDLSIGENSGCLSPNVDSIVNNIGTRTTLLNTVYDSKAAHSESAVEEETKKTVYDAPTENDETWCTVEQQPALISYKLDTIEVIDQDKDEFVVTQPGWEQLRKTASDEIKEVVEKTDATTNFLATAADADYVKSVANSNDSIGDQNTHWLSNGEANNFTDDWRTVDLGDLGITIADEIVDWKQAVDDEICDWRNPAFAEMEKKIYELVEDRPNYWKEAIIEDWRTADFGETDETCDRLFEDQQNELEAATDDNMKLTHAEMPNEYNSNEIGYMDADVLSACTIENRLNDVNGPPDSRTESRQEHYSHSNLVFGRNDEKIEESFEESQKLEHPAGQPSSTLEAKCNTDIDSGRSAEYISIGNELDISTAESPRAYRRVGDNQDGAAFVEGHQSEAEGQDIASVLENTNDPAIEKVNEMKKTKKSIDTPKKTGYPLKTGPVDAQEERQVSSLIEAVEQVPHEKDPVATANEKKNAIVKRNKSKGAPEEISKTKRINARSVVGLQNLGNTCFFNAVMQNINQSSLLYDLLKEQEFDLPLTGSMIKFYQTVSGSSSTVTPREVLHNVCRRSPRFCGGHQQDSHELLRHLLDGLRNEERESSGNPNNRKTLTKVDKVFGGHFMTVYTCKACKTPYHVCEPLLDISLPIAFDDLQNDEESSINEEDDETTGDNVQYQKAVKSMMTPLAIEQKTNAQDNHNEYFLDAEVHQLSKRQRKKRNKKAKVQHSETKKSRREGCSILDCLEAFTRTEHIEDEYLCMACHEKRVKKGATDYQMTSAKKRTLIYNPPALLTLHLKRFEQTEYGFVKCNDMISFQDMIDIGPYCSSWCMRNEENETNIWYSLYGLVVHGGSLDGGHYVAYVKLRETEDNVRRFIQESYLDRDQLTVETLTDMMEQQIHLMQNRIKRNETVNLKPKPVTGTWFYISDSHCSQVQEEEVLRQEAYLLFYERIADTH